MFIDIFNILYFLSFIIIIDIILLKRMDILKNKKEYDFCVIITTFNREKMLKDLLNDIFSNKKYKILVTVFDDGSFDDYDLSQYNIRYIKYAKNNGLKNVWKLITDTFNYCKGISADYYVYLQDDLRLKPNFFDESVRIYNSIPSSDKISLGTLMIESQRDMEKWVKFKPISFGEYYKTQWVELVFICEYKFFEVLEFKINEVPKTRWEKNPYMSCGVGEQISLRLNEMGYEMYHVFNSLTTHGDHESKYLPELRKVEKLIAI